VIEHTVSKTSESAAYQGKCPISGCEQVFKTWHNGIDAHVRSAFHAKDFPNVSVDDRYRVFLERYPRETWPRLDGAIAAEPTTSSGSSVDEDTIKAETHHSTYREKLIEHIFISQLLQAAWLSRRMMIDVLRSEIDASGYDLVLECEGVVRHVQLKSSRWNSTTDSYDINTKLAKKPAGCAVLILVREDAEARRIDLDFRFFGGKPNEPLPLSDAEHKVAKHTKGNQHGEKTLRPAIRTVTKRYFRPVPGGIGELLTLLFGET